MLKYFRKYFIIVQRGGVTTATIRKSYVKSSNNTIHLKRYEINGHYLLDHQRSKYALHHLKRLYMPGAPILVKWICTRHGNGAWTYGVCPGPAPILTRKIRVDRDRGRGRGFPDSQIRVRGRGWDSQYSPQTHTRTRPTNY